MLSYGSHVTPFDQIEWASCTGDDTLEQSVLLIKEAKRRPVGLIFGNREQRDLVSARLAEWNVHASHGAADADRGWSSTSSDGASVAVTTRHDWPAGGEPWQGGATCDSEAGAQGCTSSPVACHSGHERRPVAIGDARGRITDARTRGNGESSSSDAERGEAHGEVHRCKLGCCQVRLRFGHSDLFLRLQRAFLALVELLRRRSLEICIFGLLMPLALATVLHFWSLRTHSTYDRPWLPAKCRILQLEVQSHALYQHGDMLRNAHPNDGIYHVLQPAWRTRVTPLPVESYFNRDRVACCRQSHAQANIPSSIQHVELAAREPWAGLAFDALAPGDSSRCKGNVAVSLEETMEICKRDLRWTMPAKVVPNSTYDCWYAAHGASHVYLHVEPPVVKLASADFLAIVLVMLSFSSIAILVASHPLIHPRIVSCCRRDPRADAVVVHGEKSLVSCGTSQHVGWTADRGGRILSDMPNSACSSVTSSASGLPRELL